MSQFICLCSDSGPNETIKIDEKDDQTLDLLCKGKKLWINNSKISFRVDSKSVSLKQYPQLVLNYRPRLFERPYYSLYVFPRLIEKIQDQFFDILYIDMKISEDFSMPIFSIPIRTKEFSYNYKSLFDIIQNEIGFDISFENIYLGPTEIIEGTIGDIIQKVKDSSQNISVKCKLTDQSIEKINERIALVNQILDFESDYVLGLNNQSSSDNQSKLQIDRHTSFLNSLHSSFCGYATQVGWNFLNSFNINNENDKASSEVIGKLINIIPTQLKELFQNLLSLTPLCHPDYFFITQSIKILNEVNSKNSSNSINNYESLLIEEEEEDKNSINPQNINDSNEIDNILAQNIDDYSMSTDEFVSTVEHILGQKDDIKIYKNYDDENRKRRKPAYDNLDAENNFLFDNPINKGETEGENGSNLSPKNALNEPYKYNNDNKNKKEVDYSRFFLFGKSNSNSSNEDYSKSPTNFLFSPSTTPKKRTKLSFNSSVKSTPVSGQYNAQSPLNNKTEKEDKTPIKRRIKLDSSKKYAYTPEERRCKAKQISKFINSKKDFQLDNIAPIFSNQVRSNKLNNAVTKRDKGPHIYPRQNEHQNDINPEYPKYSIEDRDQDEDLSSLDQSNQSTEIFDFNIDDEFKLDNKEKQEYSYRKALNATFSPLSDKQPNDIYTNEKENRKGISKNKNRGKTVQFNQDDF